MLKYLFAGVYFLVVMVTADVGENSQSLEKTNWASFKESS